ncbi:hypothetical protein Patl1_14987 [Pistacia atlantica]|uniref:Uncharacterized protein n=1 Tax=Pistacia atlantica TaxID=434234 RepID=A0ACC1BA86_9ROSI|nr:hypothetical protein Patl1_14987 [Pistacia atlantica]
MQEDQKSILLNAPRVKDSAIAFFTSVESRKNPLKSQMDEAVSMLKELKQLYAGSDESGQQVKNNISTIREVCKRLQSTRQTVEPHLNQQSRSVEGKATETGVGEGVASEGKCDEGNIDSKMEGSAVPIASGSQSQTQANCQDQEIEN